MKVLCPTDFSTASINAIEYAAKFCQQYSATLTLLNIQKVYMSEGVSMFSGGERESVVEARHTAEKMDAYCSDINKLFKISCDYEIVPAMSRFEKAAGEESEQFDLVIIGTNGTDSLYEFYFGSHSFRLAKKSGKPVLIVPQDVSYKTLSRVVFASGYNKGDTLLLEQLKKFLSNFNPVLHVLHVSESDTVISKEAFNAFSRLAGEELKGDRKISFEQLFNANPAHAIDGYMNQSGSDMLAVCYEEHSILYRIFHQNIIKNLTNNPEYPVLICHK